MDRPPFRPLSRTRSTLAVVGGALVGVGVAVALGAREEVVWLSVAVGVLAALRLRDARRIAALEQRLAGLPGMRERRGERPATRAPAQAAPSPDLAAEPVPDLPAPAAMPPAPADARRARPERRSRARPDLWQHLPAVWRAPARRAWAFATGGNPIVRVALVVLFVGFGVGIRYAAQAGLFPVELRLAAAGLAGLGLTGLGWSLRRTSPAFALAVQGGGVALLYLTVYAAYAVVGMVSAPLALAGMAAVALGCGVLAVVQDAPGLAFLGAAGGFAAPVVASTGTGSHVLLFSYYLALGLGVGGLVWTRGWRSLAVLGVVGTFGVGGLWGGLEYRPELYASTQPFLVAFFALYFVLALRLAWLDLQRDDVPERGIAVDSTLVFGLPVATFLLQRGLVEGIPNGDAWSAAALAAVYLGVWAAVRVRRAPPVLRDALLAVGLAFATLAAPLAFRRVVAGALWSLEAAALVWTGVRQHTPWMRAAGIALSVGAAAVLFAEGVVDTQMAFRPETITGWVVAVSLMLSAYVLWRAGAGLRRWEATAGRGLLAGGVVWWGLTAATHAQALTEGDAERAALLAALGTSALVFAGAGRALGWLALTRAALLAAPLAALAALGEGARAAFSDASPADGWGGPAWLVVAAGLGAGLVATRRATGRVHAAACTLGLWALVAVAVLTAAQAVPSPWGVGWKAFAATVPLSLTLAALARSSPGGWLDAVTSPSGRELAGAGLALAAGVAVLGLAATPGDAAPLPTVPALTPTDLASAGALVSTVGWLRARASFAPWMGWAVGALVLIGLSGAAARGVAAAGLSAFEPDALFDSAAFQTILAIAWTLFALVLTVRASRTASRALWFGGAAVLALVVAKLFLVDLSRADALVRVAAFLGVGALMLWIGYRSPLPPADPEPASADGDVPADSPAASPEPEQSGTEQSGTERS